MNQDDIRQLTPEEERHIAKRVQLSPQPLTAEEKRGLRFEVPCIDKPFDNASAEFFIPPVLRRQNRDAVPPAVTVTPVQPPNPKTLMGQLKVPNLSVIPFTALIEEARAMQYGAFHSPRKDGTKGYGPFNWRDDNIEYLTYIEAAVRHLASAADREDIDPETAEHLVQHLGLARATIGILIDAIHHGTVIDDRPKTARGRVAELLRQYRKQPATVSTKESSEL